ncbi:MAG: MFS transporter, partial [Candidatus Nanopelagicales bacterium]|nr:MFS transporter [Candidatus Nanopelagicales bacterium]
IVWIGILVSVFQQFVGINAVIYYSNLIYQAIGFSESDAFLTSMITTAVNLTFTIVAILLIDRVGRKPLLLVGSTGMAICLATIAVVFGSAPKCTRQLVGQMVGGCKVPADIGQPDIGSTQAVIAVIALNLFIAFFASTWGPIAWVLISEMFPNSIRAAALAVAAMAQWIGNFVVSATFPGLAHISISLAYGLFTLFALLSIWFVAKKVKETKGVQLEQMGQLEAEELSTAK